MTIAFDAKRYFFNRTGLGNYSRTLIAGLQEFCPELALQLYVPKVPKQDVELPVFTADHRLGSYWRWRQMGRAAQGNGATVFHGLSNELPLDIARFRGMKVVTIHDVIFRHLPDLYGRIDREIYHRKVRFAVRNADAIIAISEATKRDLMELYAVPESKIRVVYQTVAASFWEPQKILNQWASITDQLPDHYLLSVGLGNKRKNIELIIRALALLPSEDQIHLVLVGPTNRYADSLIALAHQLDIPYLIIHIPDVPSDRALRQLYRGAQALVFPSRHEGFGLPVVEAWLSGTAVLAANNSSLPEAAGPSAWYFDANEVEDLAEAIKNVRHDARERKRRIRAGKSYVRAQFSPKVVTQRLVDLYRG